MRVLRKEVGGGSTGLEQHPTLLAIKVGGKCGQIDFCKERSLQHSVDTVYSTELRFLYLMVQHSAIAGTFHRLFLSVGLKNSFPLLSLLLDKQTLESRFFFSFGRGWEMWELRNYYMYMSLCFLFINYLHSSFLYLFFHLFIIYIIFIVPLFSLSFLFLFYFYFLFFF